MKYTLKQFEQLKRLAYELDKSLADKVQHIVGVCVEPLESDKDQIGLSVLIDDINVSRHIPETYQGLKVHIKLVNNPEFAT